MQIDPFVPGYYYHVYNQGINKEKIFKHEEHYFQFLSLCNKYLFSHFDVYAYCLMPNHFHFLLFIPEHPERVTPPFRGVDTIGHLFNAYAQWFNKQTNRTGSLFRKPFRRKIINDENYLIQVLYYIHRNPIHHKFVKSHMDWNFSSYHTFVDIQPTLLKRNEVLGWFGGRTNFINYHATQIEIDEIDI